MQHVAACYIHIPSVRYSLPVLLASLDGEIDELSIASVTDISFPLAITTTVQKFGAFFVTYVAMLSPFKALESFFKKFYSFF